ncbi:hypothetical protein DPEC_G00272270 [Dallia pectoralis]|uniref:Uncharacterized protein n=1 Tax=Dallia pectoralis TaxID=75939 RepID=A0ACC2FQ61_DALPE|nr:hypothetical protein DPEC_G00272270 [Dallia pectoralis]
MCMLASAYVFGRRHEDSELPAPRRVAIPFIKSKADHQRERESERISVLGKRSKTKPPTHTLRSEGLVPFPCPSMGACPAGTVSTRSPGTAARAGLGGIGLLSMAVERRQAVRYSGPLFLPS